MSCDIDLEFKRENLLQLMEKGLSMGFKYALDSRILLLEESADFFINLDKDNFEDFFSVLCDGSQFTIRITKKDSGMYISLMTNLYWEKKYRQDMLTYTPDIHRFSYLLLDWISTYKLNEFHIDFC